MTKAAKGYNVSVVVYHYFEGQVDLADELRDLLKDEKVALQVGDSTRRCTITGVTNQGFNGIVIHFSVGRGVNKFYRRINANALPESFQLKMIKKFAAKRAEIRRRAAATK